MRLTSLAFLAVFCVLSVSAVRRGEALFALGFGLVLGVWVASLVVEFERWQRKRRLRKDVEQGVHDHQLRIL